MNLNGGPYDGILKKNQGKCFNSISNKSQFILGPYVTFVQTKGSNDPCRRVIGYILVI